MVSGGSYDAIVVGGGHNGLVCAAYLARAGLRTVVLERRHLVGGAAVTEQPWPGYRVSTASYVVSLLPERIVRELSLASHGYEVYPLDPAYFAPFLDGGGILVWEDPERAAEEIGKISRADGAAYLRYSADVAALAELIKPLLHRIPPDPALRSAHDLPAAAAMMGYLLRRRGAAAGLVDLMTMSCADFLGRYFADQRILGALAPGGVIGMWGGPMSPGSAYVLLHHRMGEVDGIGGCWAFARGGMGAVSEAIASSARSSGVVVETSAEVSSIDVSGGRVSGVTLADGRVLTAPVVVSGVHPTTTFLSLVGPSHVPDELARDLRRFRTRSPAAKVNLALSGLPSFTARPGSELGPQHPEFIISPTLEWLERAWDAAKYGLPSERPMIDCVIPSTKDPTLAPDGSYVMSCFVQYVPYARSDGPWTPELRDALASSVIDTIGMFAPGFAGLVTHREVLTPFDLEERFGLLGGNIFQGEMSLDQLFSFRPSPLASGYRTPVRGLYLCGSGTHPGGGVMGIPGRNASRVIVRDQRVRRTLRRGMSNRRLRIGVLKGSWVRSQLPYGHLGQTMRFRLPVAAAVSAAVALAGLGIGSAVASASPAAVSACTAGDLGVWLAVDQGNGAAGSIYFPLQFTNLSGHPCSLHGFAGVSATDRNGRQLGSPASWDHTSAPRTVVLAAGATAHAVLRWSDVAVTTAPGCHPTFAATTLRIYPPNQRSATHAAFGLEVCSHAGPIFMSVGPIIPGVGTIHG